MRQDNIKKEEKEDSLDKIFKDYKKILSDLKDKQKQIIIEGELKEQIEN